MNQGAYLTVALKSWYQMIIATCHLLLHLKELENVSDIRKKEMRIVSCRVAGLIPHMCAFLCCWSHLLCPLAPVADSGHMGQCLLGWLFNKTLVPLKRESNHRHSARTPPFLGCSISHCGLFLSCFLFGKCSSPSFHCFVFFTACSFYFPANV